MPQFFRKTNRKIVFVSLIGIIIGLQIISGVFSRYITPPRPEDGVSHPKHQNLKDLYWSSQQTIDRSQPQREAHFSATEKPHFVVHFDLPLKEQLKFAYLKSVISNIAHADEDEVQVELFDVAGKRVDARVKVTKTRGGTFAVTVPPEEKLSPGLYTLHITHNGHTIEQDFTWGVLAVNTNKSVYVPEETAQLHFAVLNGKGVPVCDAYVQVAIRNKNTDQEPTILLVNSMKFIILKLLICLDFSISGLVFLL